MAGISNGELVTSSSLANVGYSEVVFRLHSILVRFVRDRGQEFVDVAFASSPHHFYQFDAIAIAMGLTTVDALVARAEPLELDHVVNQLGQHIRVLEEASSGGNESAMRSRFDQAEKARGDAVMQRLRKH